MEEMSILQKLWSMIMEKSPSLILMPFKDDKANMDGDEELPKELRHELMPRHLAVILDGNRKSAKRRGLSPIDGYLHGVRNLEAFLSLCCSWKIPIVSVFAFSSENWLCPKVELDFLLEVLEHYLIRISRSYGGRVSVIGDTSLLPNSLQELIEQIEEETKENTESHLILEMNYTGQNDIDITHACQTIVRKVKDGILQPDDITKSLLEQHLRTKVMDIPAPDFVIRTSDEISNYYLWQCAYSEMYFTNTHWPDFGKEEFVEALCSFQKRGRYFEHS